MFCIYLQSVSAEPSPETVGDTEGIGVGLGVVSDFTVMNF